MSGDIYERMQAIDRRVFYWILFFALMVPFLNPIGIPVKVNQNTRDLYEGVTALTEENVVIICIDYGVSAWAECHPAVTVCAKAALRAGAKVILLSPVTDHELTYNRLTQVTAGADFEAATYGEDYVYLGYFTGGETAVSQMAADMRSIFPEDHFGTPLDDIPLMADINTANEIDMVLSADTSDYGSYFLRQWEANYDILLAEIGIAMLGSEWMPYYIAGNAFGLSIGSRGGAELEALIGEPGEATTAMDSISVSHLLIVLAVVLANVGILAKLGRGNN
jgi:hypothetical protein